MTPQDELGWIDKIRGGDQAPFEQLYARYSQRTFNLCYRFTRDRHEAEDQLQEIFIRVLDKLDAFRGESSFATWFYRLATNHLLNFKARRGNRPDAGLDAMPEAGVPGADVPLALALERAVAQLSEGYRHVFILHDQEGFTHEEIADILGIEPATSRSQLTRARLRLRECLASHIATSKEQVA